MAKETRKWTPLLSVDFDGVLHNYDGIWSPGRITGNAIPGSMDFLRKIYMSGQYDVAISSARSRYIRGRFAMRNWLYRELIKEFGHQAGPKMDPLYLEIIEWIKWPWFKPGAILYIDDRSYLFNGTFPSMKEIGTFRPWNKPQVLTAKERLKNIETALDEEDAREESMAMEQIAGVLKFIDEVEGEAEEMHTCQTNDGSKCKACANIVLKVMKEKGYV